jgi:hypothetical protein
MRLLALVLSLGLLATTTKADNPLPPVPEGGLMLILETPCIDIATQVEAYCTISEDRLGNVYVYVEVDGEPWEIRQIVGDGYAVIWSANANVALGQEL